MNRTRGIGKTFFLILLTIPVMIFLSACSLFPEEEAAEAPVLREPPEPRINIVEVERGYIAEEIDGLSRVAARDEKFLYFEENGRVKDVFVSYGEWVEEGQILARLEVGDLEHELKLARLDLRKVKLQKERMEVLRGTSVSEYDYQLMEIDYEKVRLNIERLENLLSSSTLYAPFDGRVASLTIKETAMVEEFARVMTVADPSELELQMTVSQRNLSKIVPGLKAKVQLGSNYWAEAEVREVPSASAEIAPGQPDLRVRIDIINFNQLLKESNLSNDQLLRYNALLSTSVIIQEKENALLLPPSAIREYGNRTFVLLKDGDYRREVDVKTGIETRTSIEIIEGLEEGQQIITR